MRKNKSKRLLLAALTGLLLLAPVRDASVPETAEAAEVSATHDSRLSAFDIAPGTLSPAFSPDITEYTSTVDADVTSVSVQAVPRASASGAVIASVEGKDGLRPGVNTIKVTCSAQDNTYTVYTITLTVGSSDAGTQPDTGAAGDAQQPDADAASDAQPSDNSGSQQPSDNTGDTQQAADSTGDTQQAADSTGDTQQATDNTGKSKRSLAQRLSGKVKADGTVKLSGAEYRLSGNFTYGATSQDIPSAFGQGSIQIGDSTYPTMYCEANGVHLVYMENTDGKGATGFYYYDEVQNAVERFKYTGIGDNFVIFISNAREEVPDGYAQKTLKLPSGKKAAAYQSQFSDELKDYYLVYGINSDSSSGWYLYDKSQGTYLRYSSAFAAGTGWEDEDNKEEEVARTVSLTKYNTLNEKYTELKESRVKIVSILVVAIVLLIILFTALLLHSRDADEGDEETGSRKKKSRKSKKQMQTVSKSSLAAGRSFEGNASKKARKVTKTFTQEPSGYRDTISSPDEIRTMNREQEVRRKADSMPSQKSAEQRQMEQRAYEYEQRQNAQRMYASDASAASPVQRNPQRDPLLNQPSAGQPDSVQMAAERMRQSVRYLRPASKAAEPEHDPMDDWDMEETVSRRPQKSAKASRKKRGYKQDDMEIMDLNDL